MSEHISVFKNEVLKNFEVHSSGAYVDLTLGGAGHFSDILEALSGGTLIGFDLEKKAIEQLILDKSWVAKEFNEYITVIKVSGNTIYLVNTNFEKLGEVLLEIGVKEVDGVLADLGWSTDQLERIPGLSYRRVDRQLDMRFSEQLGVTAADVLNAYGYNELIQLFDKFADIRGKRAIKLVKGIIEQRRFKKFEVVQDLIDAINSIHDSAFHRGSSTKTGKYPVFEGLGDLPARVFQALRIVVNQELSTLQSMLPHAWNALKAGGALQIITFHSGEEKVLLAQLERWESESCIENINSSKFMRPTVAELRQNLSARSAKLWSLKKC